VIINQQISCDGFYIRQIGRESMGSWRNFVGVPALQVLGRHSLHGADLRSWWGKR